MATSMPSPFHPQVPVTPPPDQHVFFKGPFGQMPPRSDFSRAAYEASGMRPPPQGPTPAPSQTHLNINIPPHGIPPTGTHTPAATPPNTTTAPEAAMLQSILQDPSVDPRYLAMASRIAAYYQQRCQAVSNYQQQRCQAWANAQRQKCQEMMQAAMLIVAWYIRDRISRRRRKQRRAFKQGLKRRGGGNDSRSRITKGEAVRRWVLRVPAGAAAADDAKSRVLDKEEMEFEIDRDVPAADKDKDAHLFSVADNLIKSQLTRIDVPLLGALSFDESDESESESEEEFEEGEEEEQEEDEDWEGDEVDAEGRKEEVEVAGSKSVHAAASTRSSRKRAKSSCDL
ncbi:hypothetical protein B0T18DRAFT_386119 [Schizothecium vesticola]|uniref:Uncharacterized protein n=1 Tax=Schizothecium vesticola TaxID=314040 RepID=A0AA40FAI4_9PEZI|nr:hypothetical protein B0T18DRAFT_386119 [Schizothecium vesticola]